MRVKATGLLLVAAAIVLAAIAGGVDTRAGGAGDVVRAGCGGAALAPSVPSRQAGTLATLGRAGAPMTAIPAVAGTFGTEFDRLAAEREQREALRVVAAGEPLADEAAALAEIRAHLDAAGVSAEQLARALDVRPNVVRTLLAEPSKIPAGPRHTLLRDARAWCTANAHERALRASRFVRTAPVRLAVGLARGVKDTGTIGLLSGGPGLGKSHALLAVAAEIPGAVVLRAGPDTRGARGLLRAIGEAAGQGRGGPAGGTVKAGIQAVRAAGGLLVIDEAHLLSTSALEAARAVFDGAGVGLLLVGTTALTANVDPAADPLCGPLASRVALACDLDAELLAPGSDGKTRPWLTAAELREILVRQGGGTPDRESAALLLDLANTDHRGHLRSAVDVFKVAGGLARQAGHGGEIHAEDVRAALALRPRWRTC